MKGLYEEMQEMLGTVKNEEWNTQTACYFIGRIHQAYELGSLNDEEWRSLLKKVPISDSEKEKINF